jgi:hypothetical protein
MVLVVPFLMQISVAVGLTGWLSWRNGQEAVTDLVQDGVNSSMIQGEP